MDLLCRMKNEENELTEIMKSKDSYLYKTHNYPIFYYPAFQNIRNDELQILYIGDWTEDENTYNGWKTFFINSNIYFLSHTVINNIEIENNMYDVVFVKNCHINVELFIENHRLLIRQNGVIIIENIDNSLVDYYQCLVEEWRRLHSLYLAFRLFHIPNKNNNVDNRLCIIHHLLPQLMGPIDYSIVQKIDE